MRRIATILGTRPEAVKLAPLVQAMSKHGGLRPVVVATAQHRDLLDQVLDAFQIVPDHDLDLMVPNQKLWSFAGRALAQLGDVLETIQPDMVVVQGDTTTAMIGAVAAAYRKCPVAHVEAGLRSYDRENPFPEETNRVVLSHIASLHFAPTAQNRENLVREGIPDSQIVVTGNSVIDALLHVASSLGPDHLARVLPAPLEPHQRLVLVTVHRRESFGPPLAAICRAIVELTERFRDVVMLYPVHPNPNVRAVVTEQLSGRERIHLIDPLGYVDFIAAMKACHLILTDSGGVQEEAPSLQKPVLILRDVTERPEAVAAGTARLVGRRTEDIVRTASLLLTDPGAYRAMTGIQNPYGDGRASERMVDRIASHAWDRR
jgi:UDP-N-acetylglucosamine 2-epimerase (non-hydrolysing)